MSDELGEGEKIEATFRNGSLTAVGIILGFSLSFISHWASNPNDWQLLDAIPLVPLLVGTGLQVKALAQLLGRDSLRVERYDRAMRLFLIGVLTMGFGMGVALTNDILGLSSQNLLG